MPYKLTAKAPDPYTGQQNSYLGWHFTMVDALDILQGLIWLKVHTKWSYDISPRPGNDSLIRLSLMAAVGNVQHDDGSTGAITNLIVDDTQYFYYDNDMIVVVDQATVSENFDIAQTALPTPPAPAPVDTTPAPPMGMPAFASAPTNIGDGSAVTVITPPPPQQPTQ